MFHGSIVALVTPMHTDTTIDYESLSSLVEWHITSGTDGIVILGSTGESINLTLDERKKIIQRTVEQVSGRVPVIAGTGNASTAFTTACSQQAVELGVDGCLVVTPFYNKPTQQGLYLHFKHVAQQISAPIILYNVPSRTGCDLKPETVARLTELPNIVGLKEATGDMQRAETLLRLCEDKIDLLSGDDPTALELIALGGKGVISITANVAPLDMHEMCAAGLKGEHEHANLINKKLALLHQELCIESNPIPVKWALHRLKKMGEGIRLPLTPLSECFEENVLIAMRYAGLIN